MSFSTIFLNEINKGFLFVYKLKKFQKTSDCNADCNNRSCFKTNVLAQTLCVTDPIFEAPQKTGSY